mmetsp:Transcript_11635/g.21761  ORF Transcript_11635/g.21761 Transcript_11635/m.21761 type:complete len:344 (-) Transcript_11635:500-1531(-)
MQAFIDDMFESVKLHHVKELRQILTNHPEIVNCQDINGDQPMHIAARKNDVSIGQILVEYDARVGRRNYQALTPMGEARMNCSHKYIRLLQRHYVIDIDASLGLEEPEKYVFKRTNLESIPSQEMMRENEKQRRFNVRSELQKKFNSFQAAMRVLKFLERCLSRKIEHIRSLEMNSATRIQTNWRERRAKRHYKAMKMAATIIQSFERMRTQRRQYLNFEYERLWQYRASRNLALSIQSLWRGHKGRSRARRKREKRHLPDPRNALNFDYWLSVQKASHPPNRIWGVYHEYILSGTPRTWYERNHIKLDGKYYRDVKFYAHRITRRAYWDQPQDWYDADQRNF